MQPMVLEQLEMHRQKRELPDNTHTHIHTHKVDQRPTCTG